MNKAEELIACLEGEIAKRDEELAACRTAVENCELFRARIAELENECSALSAGACDGVVGDDYGHAYCRYKAELAAIKAQDTVGEVVGWYRLDRPYEMTSYPSVCATWHKLGAPVAPLYAAHAQQVSVPVTGEPSIKCWSCHSVVSLDDRADADGNCPHCRVELDLEEYLRAMLAAAPAAPASPAVDAGVTGHD